MLGNLNSNSLHIYEMSIEKRRKYYELLLIKLISITFKSERLSTKLNKIAQKNNKNLLGGF